MTSPSMKCMLWRLGVALICAAPPPLQAQVTLSPAQLEKAALINLRGENPARAVAFADALIMRDGNDLTAYLIRARGLRDMGRFDAARNAAAKAWALSKTPSDKFSSALIMAQSLSSSGKRTRAQFWLRRAVQHAPTPALAARAKRDFRHVRQQNKWSTHLSFTLAPNSNINNGSARDRSYLNHVYSELLFGEPVEFQLTGASRALSGLEVGGSLQSRYRFAQTPTKAHDLHFGLSYRSFILSANARDNAPTVSGSDFAFGALSLGYGYKHLNLERRGEFSLNGDIGQTFYGGAQYAGFARARLSQTYRLNAASQLRVALLAETQVGQRTADTDRFEFSASLSRRMPNRDNLFIEASLTTQSSPNLESEYGEFELRLGYARAKPIKGAAIQFGFGTSFRAYDVSRHDPAGRDDLRMFADVTATFKNIDYYGFNPALTLSASSTDSNIGLFDVNRFGISLGIRSSF